MRILVTGALNPWGRAIIDQLDGHHIRAFGVPVGDTTFAGNDHVTCYPGDVAIAGQIEPVLSEREILIHASNMDAPVKDKKASGVHIERGTLYARFGAEREQVDVFLHVHNNGKDFQKIHQMALDHVQKTQGEIDWKVVTAGTPEATASEISATLASHLLLGKQPGRNDAVTA